MSTTLAETGSAGLSISQQAARLTSVAKRRRNTADIGNHEVASGRGATEGCGVVQVSDLQ